MPKILHSTNLCNPTLFIQKPTFCIFFCIVMLHVHLVTEDFSCNFFFGSLNLATSDRCLACCSWALITRLRRNTQLESFRQPSLVTRHQACCIAQSPRPYKSQRGVRLSCHRKPITFSYPGIQTLEATTQLHLHNEAAATSKEDLTHFIFQTFLFRSEIQAGATKDGIVHENTTLRRSSYRRPAQHLRRRQVCDLNPIPKLPTNTRN